MRRSVADTDGNGCGIAKRYAYRYGNRDRDSDSHCDGDYAPTDAYSYSSSKGYPDAKDATDAAAETIVGHIENWHFAKTNTCRGS